MCRKRAVTVEQGNT